MYFFFFYSFKSGFSQTTSPPFWIRSSFLNWRPGSFLRSGQWSNLLHFLNKSNRRVQICHKTEIWWIQLNPAEDNSAKLITPEPIWIIDKMSNPASLRSCAHCQSFGEDSTLRVTVVVSSSSCCWSAALVQLFNSLNTRTKDFTSDMIWHRAKLSCSQLKHVENSRMKFSTPERIKPQTQVNLCLS